LTIDFVDVIPGVHIQEILKVFRFFCGAPGFSSEPLEVIAIMAQV
jgi:hypothetical protein